MRKSTVKTIIKRATAAILALFLTLTSFCGYLPSSFAYAAVGDTMTAKDPNWHFTCIDAGKTHSEDDVYEQVSLDTAGLSSSHDKALVFFALLSYFAGAGDAKAAAAINGIKAAGLPYGGNFPTGWYAVDLNIDQIALLFPETSKITGPGCAGEWLNNAVANPTAYLQAAGILGGGAGTSTGGAAAAVPAALNGHTTIQTALQMTGSGQEYSIVLDAAFLSSPVKIQLSTDGTNWSDSTAGSWTLQSTYTSGTLTVKSSSTSPEKLYVRIDPTGTPYASSGGGGYSDPESVFDNMIVCWMVKECHGEHTLGQGSNPPMGHHQRMCGLNWDGGPTMYFLCTDKAAPPPR